VLREPDQRIVDNPGAPPNEERARVIQSSIAAAAFSPDSRTIATLSETNWSRAEGRLHLWDARTRKLLRKLFAREHNGGGSLVWSPDDQRLLLIENGTGRLVHLDKPEVIEIDNTVSFLFGGHGYFLRQRIEIAQPFSPDGKRLAGVGPNHTLVIL